MMKMDGRDSAECQNWEKRDINVIFGKVFKSQKDKNCYSASSQIRKGGKNVKCRILVQRLFFLRFPLERETSL